MLFIFSTNVNAQTLNEKLLAEDPIELAEQAREYGDIVRGAILFHQGNINCAKCHRPSAEKDRLGPDLSKVEAASTDQFVVESILQPSKTIKKGFETVVASTLEGKVFSGLLVSEDAEKIVIRDAENVDQLFTLARESIDEIRPGKKSSMPDNLANELKNRQQFLDLLRYVMDIRDRGPQAADTTSDAGNRRELSSELEGLVLIQDRNCTSCHQSNSLDSFVTRKQAPDLRWSGKSLNPHYLAEFIAEPNATKPGTTMPHLLGKLSEPDRKQSAEAIAHYLVSKNENTYQRPAIDAQAATRGFQLFHSIGCVACHAARDKSGAEAPAIDSKPLGNLSKKHGLNGLVAFLGDPHAVRPSGRMPNTPLTHFEAVDIANFLLQNPNGDSNAAVSTTEWQVDPALAETGKQLFSGLNCASCHGKFDEQNTTSVNSLPLDQVRPDQGCLSNESGDWPKYDLSERERTAITATLNQLPQKLSNEQQIRLSLKAFNCVACHDRGGFGGIPPGKNHYFETSNLNLGDQGRIPPTLTGVGAKLKSSWVRDVMVNARSIRPYSKTRMPQFGEENIAHLVELFEATDKLPETKVAATDRLPEAESIYNDAKKMREFGLQLAGNKGLNCAACHTYQYKQADTMPAVDLTEMTERLKKDWFHQYMLAPQKFNLNTVMPSFWPGGEAIRKDLEGDPELQVEALYQYLLDGRQARMPAGVVREKLEIVVTDEARMLRRSYPEIGKRGIGVGYPGAVNIAFDAEQMRLAMIWKGKFVDPGGVWTGQGSGQVRPMSQATNLAKGPDFDNALNPWLVDEGRPPNHQVKGYTLDKVQRPTFRYVVDSVQVENFFKEAADEQTKQTALRRLVSLTSDNGRHDLSFRIASGNKIAKADDGSFSIDDKLKIRILSNHSAAVGRVGDLEQLHIFPVLVANEKQQIEIEYFWE